MRQEPSKHGDLAQWRLAGAGAKSFLVVSFPFPLRNELQCQQCDVVCKIPLELCPPGWTLNWVSGTCIKVVNWGANWYRARQYCQKRGGDLVWIDNSFQGIFLKDQISRHRSKWYFIGLRDKYKNGTFVWLDNDQERTLFTAWEYARYKGIRHLEGRLSDCVVMNSKLSKGWQTASCWVWKRFICEKYSAMTRSFQTARTRCTGCFALITARRRTVPGSGEPVIDITALATTAASLGTPGASVDTKVSRRVSRLDRNLIINLPVSPP
ncbi:C-type lectin domain family 4 member A [Elysia marginata]|uniref:C-type lectin domain family 4 member A n=1 Tax=Elysia marginata TaxID=1093978 RepID=A0AAV4JJ83_9GAST|nr:C-type lectin domain family 4 member A [Elysia marginata]